MRKISWMTGFLLMVGVPGLSASAQSEIPVVDSYTVDQRYTKNLPDYPEIRWPTLNLTAGQTIDFDRLYKEDDGRKLHVDVFGPAAELRNGHAVILIHGGAWRSGNKSHVFPLANLLAQRGYTVFTPEYRLSAEAPYPAGLVDINDLIVWVKENADDFEISPDAIAIAGGSSGGHMAALLAYSADGPLFKTSAEDDTSVSALIDMDGGLTLTSEEALRYENYAKERSGIGLWVGGAYETLPGVWAEASPVAHITDAAPRTLILSSGQTRFTAGHDEVEAKLGALGVDYEFFSYEDLFHTFWLFEPYVSDVAERIDEFLGGELNAEQ